MTHEKNTSPAGSHHNDDVLVERTSENTGAYIANPLAGLTLDDVTGNVMGPAIGIGSTAVGTMFVKRVLAPRLPASVAKFAPLISGVVAALATAPLALWKKEVGVQAAGTALMLGVTMQAMQYLGAAPTTGAYVAEMGAYSAERVGNLPPGMFANTRAEALPPTVNSALTEKGYGKLGNAYGTAYGQYVG